MKFGFIHAERAQYPVDLLCTVLEVSRSGYYAWRGRPRSARATADVRLTHQVLAAHRRGQGSYGSPRIHQELRAQGVRVGRKRVERLMRAAGLHARVRRRVQRTTDSRHDSPIAPNVLERAFQTEAPNRVWVTDVTYVPTAEGWLYLAAILDLFSRRIVGWATRATNDRALALAALERARRSRRPRPGLLHHTDQGSPYASQEYRTQLALLGMVASMSRKGNCWDNAVSESFFGTIKGERLDHTDYPTRAAAHADIEDSIENFYNPVRRHSTLGYLSPIEFELRAQFVEAGA